MCFPLQKRKAFESNLNKGSYKKYIRVMYLHWKPLFFILVMSIVISLIGLLGTYLFQTVIDEYVHGVTNNNGSEHSKNLLELLVGF